MRLGSGILVVAALIAVLAAPADAATDGDPYWKACLAGTTTTGCTTQPMVRQPYASAMSADGEHLYVGIVDDGTNLGNGILQFDVDPSTGALSPHAGPAGCVTSNGSPIDAEDPTTRRCQYEPDIGGVTSLLVVGGQLYASTSGGAVDAVLTFDVDPASGELTRKPGAAGCVHNGGASESCGAGRALGGPWAMAVNAAADSLYLRTNGGLAVFTRSVDGTLTQKPTTSGCLREDPAEGCADAAGLDSSMGEVVRQIQVVGDTLYVPNNGCSIAGAYGCEKVNGGVGVFHIGSDGTLTQTLGSAGGCITSDGRSGTGPPECVDGHDWLIAARSVTGRGDDLYVGSTYALLHYRRSTRGLLTGTDGLPTGGEIACHALAPTPACTATAGVANLSWLSLTPDGKELLGVNSGLQQALALLRRDPATGALTPRPDPKDCFSGAGDPCTRVPTLSALGTLAISPDSEFIYVTGHTINVFQRDFAPVCESSTTAVPHNTSVVVSLRCADANGDAVRLEIVSDRSPAAGHLGMIDQASDTVRYSPFLAFSGTDVFGYRGVAREMTSEAVDVTLHVAGPQVTDPAPPPASPPATPGPAGNPPAVLPSALVPSQLRVSWRAGRVTRVRRFRVTDLPAGATVSFKCSGGRRRGCRGIRAVHVLRATASLDLRSRLRRLALRRGARFDVTVSASGFIGKVRRYTIRRNRKPTVTSLCLPPGATVPVRTCPPA